MNRGDTLTLPLLVSTWDKLGQTSAEIYNISRTNSGLDVYKVWRKALSSTTNSPFVVELP